MRNINIKIRLWFVAACPKDCFLTQPNGLCTVDTWDYALSIGQYITHGNIFYMFGSLIAFTILYPSMWSKLHNLYRPSGRCLFCLFKSSLPAVYFLVSSIIVSARLCMHFLRCLYYFWKNPKFISFVQLGSLWSRCVCMVFSSFWNPYSYT